MTNFGYLEVLVLLVIFVTMDGITDGPIVPTVNRRQGSCSVKLDDETAMVIGGYPEAGNKFVQTFFVNLVTFTWTPGPATNVGHYIGSACAVFRNPAMNYRRVVVIMGGGAVSSTPSDSTEFYDIDNGVWVIGEGFF